MKHITKLEQGKQGVTGILELDDQVYVYKMSQYLNYLTNHEYLILKGLQDLHDFCPHFCDVYKMTTLPVNPNFKNLDNPFEQDDTLPMIEMEVLLIEYIENSIPLLSLIVEEETIPIEVVMSQIKQTLIAITISQKTKQFAHYDLHSMNILMKTCDKNELFLYILDNSTSICIPTYGYYPVIIDYGFSYSEDINQHPSYCPLAYTDAGYMSPRYDPLVDAKIFLVSVAEDLKQHRLKNDKTHTFRNVVKNLFRSLHIDWKSGWDINRGRSLVDQLFNYIENVNEKSELLLYYPHFCMDILQSLIILPLKPKVDPSLRMLRKAYRVFVNEFYKIEEMIGNTFYALYIFRRIVDNARELRNNYVTDPKGASLIFSEHIFEQIYKIAKYCNPKNVNYDKLLCALYVFQDHMETQLFYMLNNLVNTKLKEYNAMEIKSVLQMISILDINIPSEFTLTEHTVLRVWDSVNKKNDALTLPKEYVHACNKLDSIYRGQFLGDIYREYQMGLRD